MQQLRVNTKLLPSAASELEGAALMCCQARIFRIDEGRSWVGFVCIITQLFFMCVFAAVQNLALIQALRSRQQGERRELPSGWGMDTLLCLFSASRSL